jgi:hypothetical protein
MKIVEDFNIESESESDEDSSTSSMVLRETTGEKFAATTTKTIHTTQERRSSPSFNETEVSNRIKMELDEDEDEEYSEIGPALDRIVDATKNEPPDDYAEEAPGRPPFDQLAESEMCRVYETLAEVKPPPGILPLPAGAMGELMLRFRWRILTTVSFVSLLRRSVSNKMLNCQLWTLGC